ncbi:hypothetical protein Nmel_003265 [Mimus melanotis]
MLLCGGVHAMGLRQGPGQVPRSSVSPGPSTRALRTSAKCIVLPVVPFFSRWLHAKLPRAQTSPQLPSASACLCPRAAVGKHFLPGKQPLQPGTFVSSWQHSLGELGLEMFVLGVLAGAGFFLPWSEDALRWGGNSGGAMSLRWEPLSCVSAATSSTCRQQIPRAWSSMNTWTEPGSTAHAWPCSATT